MTSGFGIARCHAILEAVDGDSRNSRRYRVGTACELIDGTGGISVPRAIYGIAG